MLVGLIFACLVAGFSHVLFAKHGPGPSNSEPPMLEFVLLTATHYFLFSAPFAFIAAVLAEWLSLRSLSYFLCSALAIAFAGFVAQYANEGPDLTILNDYAIRAFLTAGFSGGFVYWLVAGRSAGREAGG
jgi:hypothetical protein